MDSVKEAVKNVMVKSGAAFLLFAFTLGFQAFAETAMVNGITWTYVVFDGEAELGGGSDGRAVPVSIAGDLAIPQSLGGYPVTAILAGAFGDCTGLTSVTIPDSVTEIDYGAFSGCNDALFDTTTIPGVQLVDGWAVDHTYSLSGHLDLTGVRGIGYYAFEGCSGLTSVTIPNSVMKIGYHAFEGCSGLMSVTIPDSVTSIGGWAFYGCRSLTSVTIPDSVTSIRRGAFAGCGGLSSVTIPDSVTNITGNAFYDCSGLMSFAVGNGNANYKSVNGLLLSKDGETLIAGVNGDVTIPDGVTSIGETAFEGCSGLTSVTIPDSVKSIGAYAFSGCSGLASVTIPDSVKSIGDYAFSNCKALKLVEFEGNRCDMQMDVQNVFFGTPWLQPENAKPENDDFEAAISLAGESGRIVGTNVGATREINESELGLGTATIWWKWTAPLSYEVSFDTLGSFFDTVLGVYVKTEDGLSEIAYNDDCDESNEAESRVVFNADEGTTYYIVTSGYDSDVGTISLAWEPYSDTPIPEVANDSAIESALAGSTDMNLAVNITSTALYDAYRTWATFLKENNVSALAIKRSPYAWLSFALGADVLINKELTSNDVNIELFSPASTDGNFEFVVSVKGVNIGGGLVEKEILKENLKKVIGIEGASIPVPDAFSSDNINITFDALVEGKVKFIVSPPVNAGSQFFMRAKVQLQ